MGSLTSPQRLGITPHPLMRHGFTYGAGYRLTPGQPSPGLSYPPASPHHSPTTSPGPIIHPPRAPEGTPRQASPWLVSLASALARVSGYGNINPLSIDYAHRPRLRSRLTLGG